MRRLRHRGPCACSRESRILTCSSRRPSIRIHSGAERFVEQLYERWSSRQPEAAAPRQDSVRFLPPERDMPDHSVFISDAREDLPAVQRLRALGR